MTNADGMWYRPLLCTVYLASLGVMRAVRGDEQTETGALRGRTVSMIDVARLAGVSQQTVSRVANDMPNVSEATRKRVRQAMDQLGFRVNYAGRSLRDGKYHSVGFCVNDITEFGNLTMLDGITTAARDCDYAVTLVEMSKDQEFSLGEASRMMSALPIDGLIFGMSRLAPDFEEFRPLPSLPTVIVTMCEHPFCTTVDSDQYHCACMLMDHLFSFGHREIRYVGGPESSIDEQFRQAGWRDSLEREGLCVVEPQHGDWSANSGYEIACRMLEQDRAFTAVFAENDQMANGVICALREHGMRVPEDISVVGVDDSLAEYVPNSHLTTVRFDTLKRGTAAFEHALGKGSDGEDAVAIRIPGELIDRGSVAPARS